MNHAAVWALIKPQLKRLGKNPDGASKEAGVPDAIRNIQRGRGGATYKTLTALAPVLKLPAQKLLDAANSRRRAPAAPQGTEVERIRDEMERIRELIAKMQAELEGYQRTLELLERWPVEPRPRIGRKR